MNRAAEPYICDSLSEEIASYLNTNGFNVSFQRGGDRRTPTHFWVLAEKDDQAFHVDGSWYQRYYDKPLSTLLHGPVLQTLKDLDINNLMELLTIIDCEMPLQYIDAGEYDFSSYPQQSEAEDIANMLGQDTINNIKGQLLPHMLTVSLAHPELKANQWDRKPTKSW